MEDIVNKRTTFLEYFDFGAEPVTMTYKGKKSHPTKCGGCLNILFTTVMSVFFISRLWVLLTHGGD